MTTTGEVGQRMRFDVREFARTAQGNHRDTLQLAEYSKKPLNDDSVRMVRYLGRLESATMEHLRNLLVTATHKDARVTAFLVTWAFEKFWIADALDAVLEANGSPRFQDAPEGKVRKTRKEAADRRGPIRRALSGIRLGVPLIAVHTTQGLVDEWVTRAAYVRLSAQSKSAALASTVSMILDIKKRHASFFDDESRSRLTQSPRAVTLTRKALMTSSWPIGAVDRAAEDRSFFETYVFGGARGLASAAEIENQVASLPGLDDRIGEVVAQKLLP
ncbi:MAG TPA: hypothetical protein VHX87_12435 [Galbitalea sp.]|jgi:hypothetical protein|nr:hypothetical protein [Galbitalea sp.]